MMYFLLPLLAMMLAASIYFVWRIRFVGRRKLCVSTPSVREPAAPSFKVEIQSAQVQTRVMEWISIRRFMTVLAESGNLIVIDLRANDQRGQFPVPGAFALAVEPDELAGVLERLPADRSIVFCGATNLSVFMILTSSCMRGSAPLYVLEGVISLAEVA
jgi:hypothetical protein